jgi:hypothetical protein
MRLPIGFVLEGHIWAFAFHWFMCLLVFIDDDVINRPIDGKV